MLVTEKDYVERAILYLKERLPNGVNVTHGDIK